MRQTSNSNATMLRLMVLILLAASAFATSCIHSSTSGVVATPASPVEPHSPPATPTLQPTLLPTPTPTCNPPWPTPPSEACPWLPSPTPEPTFPPPTPFVVPTAAQTPTPLPLPRVADSPAGEILFVAFFAPGTAPSEPQLLRALIDAQGQLVGSPLPFTWTPLGDTLMTIGRQSVSPNGRYLTSAYDTESGESIAIVDLASAQQTAYVSEGRFFNWHPNGHEFLFESGGADLGLWLVDARTGGHKLIAQQPTLDISGAAISPDGQRLIYATNTFDVHQIWTANADGSEPRLLLESDVIVYVYSWSPDGRYLLYVGEPSVTASDSGGPLWVMDREGRDRRPLNLPFIFGFGFQPVWSPVGHRVAAVGSAGEPAACWEKDESFRADPLCRYRGTGVYVEDVEIGETWLAAENALDPTWSPDGSMLAVAKMDEDEQVDIWIVNIGDRSLRQITDTPELDRYPIWLRSQ